jgi:hypothetical protein
MHVRRVMVRDALRPCDTSTLIPLYGARAGPERFMPFFHASEEVLIPSHAESTRSGTCTYD